MTQYQFWNLNKFHLHLDLTLEKLITPESRCEYWLLKKSEKIIKKKKRTYRLTFARSWSISRTSHWSIIDIPERINWVLSGYISSINPKIIKKNIKDYWHFFICFYMQLKVSLEYYVSWEFANKTLASDNFNETSLHAPSKMMAIFNKILNCAFYIFCMSNLRFLAKQLTLLLHMRMNSAL